jgi:hypothetical protein
MRRNAYFLNESKPHVSFLKFSLGIMCCFSLQPEDWMALGDVKGQEFWRWRRTAARETKLTELQRCHQR